MGVVHGIPYAMTPAPTIRHQRICNRSSYELLQLLENCGKCEVLLPMDWRITDQMVVEPDLSIVCEEIKRKFFQVTPSVIFEIQ